MRWGVILAVFLVLAMSCAVEWEGRRVNGFSRRTRVGEHPETIVNAYEAVHALHRTEALRTDEDKKTAIETLITAYRNAYKIPGLGYGVVQNKQPLLSGGVGVRGHTQAAGKFDLRWQAAEMKLGKKGVHALVSFFFV